eukprot:CCRYP_001971-RA/>CCRYP_001971-RA protein AED:0.45 eAED:0.58 QI:0/0/0/1/0/0/3/0/370
MKSTTSSNLKKSYDKKVVSNKTQHTEADVDMPSVNYNINHKQEVITTNTKDRLGVTALVAIMEPATESQSGRAYKQPLRNRPTWFHHYLQHPGTKRLEETLCLSMYWKGLRTTVQSHVKKCHSCQVNKRRQIKYGKLPTKLAITNPWEALCVDLIGPSTLKGKDKTQIDFMCITMIDPATSWFEIVELPVSQLPKLDIPMGTKGHKGKDTHVQQQQPYFDKTSATVGNLVNRTWFSRYPRSQYIIYDNGSEFKLHFETLCESYGLKPNQCQKPSSERNTRRVHRTIMAMLRTAELDMADTISESDIADFLTNAAWAVRSTYHTVLKTSPGAAIFGRDMLFDVPYIADWSKIGEYRQRQTDRNTRRRMPLA